MCLAIECEYCMFIVSARSETATSLMMAVLAHTVQIIRWMLTTAVADMLMVGFYNKSLDRSRQMYILCTLVSKAHRHSQMQRSQARVCLAMAAWLGNVHLTLTLAYLTKVHGSTYTQTEFNTHWLKAPEQGWAPTAMDIHSMQNFFLFFSEKEQF